MTQFKQALSGYSSLSELVKLFGIITDSFSGEYLPAENSEHLTQNFAISSASNFCIKKILSASFTDKQLSILPFYE